MYATSRDGERSDQATTELTFYWWRSLLGSLTVLLSFRHRSIVGLGVFGGDLGVGGGGVGRLGVGGGSGGGLGVVGSGVRGLGVGGVGVGALGVGGGFAGGLGGYRWC